MIARTLAAVMTALALTLAAAYAWFPNVQVRTVTVTNTRPVPTLPARPTRAQVIAAFRNVETLGTQYQLGPAGYPLRCSAADSTRDPDDYAFTWHIQWCVKVTQREAITGGLVG